MSESKEKLLVMRIGLCHMHCCVPRSWPNDEIEVDANKAEPTGVSSQWRIQEDAGRVQCDDHEDRVHVILTC